MISFSQVHSAGSLFAPQAIFMNVYFYLIGYRRFFIRVYIEDKEEDRDSSFP